MEKQKTETVDFYAHEHQATALRSKKRYIIINSGIQGGKSTVGAYWLRLKIDAHPKSNHLVGFPNYPLFRQSTWMALQKTRVLEGLGRMNWQAHIFTLNTGGNIYFRSAEKPGSIEGITDVESVWLDEAGNIKEESWINYEGRSSFKKAQVFMTTTPYGWLNWLNRDFVQKIKKGDRDDADLISFPSVANPAFDRTEYERQRILLSPQLFRRRYGGEYTRLEGLVYELHEQENFVPKEQTFPAGTRYFGGLDWGYGASPFALLVRAVTPDGMHYDISEFKKSGLTPTDIARIVKQKQEVYGVSQWFCDSSRPEMIEEVSRMGCHAVGATHDIVSGIEVHNALIRSRRYKIPINTCPGLIDEYEQYAYPQVKDEKAIPDQPIPVHNHYMDVTRYISYMTRTVGSVRKIQKGMDREIEQRWKRTDPESRITWLKKERRKSRGGYIRRK